MEYGDGCPQRLNRGMIQKWKAYSYTVPLCVPYWPRSIYWQLLKTVLGGQVSRGASVNQLTKVLSDYFAGTDILLCTSGRIAIRIVLRAMGITDKQEVIVPTFCCQSVVDPILQVGAIPVFADVGEDLNLTVETVEPCLTNRTAAIIVPHLFGNPADIEKIVELGHARGVPVIDDAAQALGATVNGRLVGTFGAAGVVSFGNGKVCFGTGGGILIFNQSDLLDKAKSIIKNPSGSIGDIVTHAMSVLVWRRWRRWTLPIHVALSKFPKRKKEHQRTIDDEAMSNLDASVALTLLTTLQENLSGRRKHAVRYQKTFERHHHQQFLVAHKKGSSHLTQVLQVPPLATGESRRAQVIQSLKDAGFEVTASYKPLHLLPQYQAYVRGPLENIERRWSHLIELPTEPWVSNENIDQISGIIEESLH